MKKVVTSLAMTLCSLGVISTVQSQQLPTNLVQDGGFEIPQLNHPTEEWRDFLAGDDIGPWHVNTGNVSLHDNNVINLGMFGAGGLQHVDIAQGTSLQQTVSGLSVGKRYAIRFNYAKHSGVTSDTELKVEIGSSSHQVQVSNAGDQEWKTAEFSFVADSESEILKLTELKGEQGSGTLVDGIEVFETPLSVSFINKANSNFRSVYSIQAGASVDVISGDKKYNGALFQVDPELYEKCQFDDPNSYGDGPGPDQLKAIVQGNISALRGPVLNIRHVWPDQRDQFGGGFTRYNIGQRYQFVYGDYNNADIRFITSELCRRDLGKFTLEVKDREAATADFKNGQSNLIDLSSIPVAMNDALQVLPSETNGGLYKVDRDNYLKCNLPETGKVHVGDFASGSITISVGSIDLPIPGVISYKPGHTYYFIKTDEGQLGQSGVSQACKAGAKFSLRVNQ